MSRRIITAQQQAAGEAAPKLDSFFDRIIKYIPADVVAGWVTARGLASSQGLSNTTLWIAAAVGLVITAIWTHKNTKIAGQPPAKTQIALATLAFAVWVIALGNPPVTWNPGYGALILIGFTLVSGLIVPKE